MKSILLDTFAPIARRWASPPIRRPWRRAAASLRAPALRWSVGKRLMAYVALAAVAFVIVTALWRALRADSLASSAASIETLERRLLESRAKLAQLPRMRDAAAATAHAQRSPGGELHAVADVAALAALATRTGITLRALEPASAADSRRRRNGGRETAALRIVGRTDFDGLYAFLQGLSTLPRLVAPETVSVKRESGALAFAATLNVFDVVPAQRLQPPSVKAQARSAGDESTRLAADPFRAERAARQGGMSATRLVGLVRDASRSLAVFEGASGAQAAVVAPGQVLGAERVVRIDLGGVLLASRAGERRIALPEGER